MSESERGFRPPRPPESPEASESKESRETPRPRFAFVRASTASERHQNRNEDAALGDRARIAKEQAHPPGTETTDPLRDQAMFVAYARSEAQYADTMDTLGIGGTFDGVGGDGKGVAAIASRLAALRASESLHGLPPEVGAEASALALAAALTDADATMRRLRKSREDYKNTLFSTADLYRVVPNGDGRFVVAFAHAGDGRLYHYALVTDELHLKTRDDNKAMDALNQGLISRTEYDIVTLSTDPVDFHARLERLPRTTKELAEKKRGQLFELFLVRNKLTQALGGGVDVTTGMFDAEAGDVIMSGTDGISILHEDEIRDVFRRGGDANDVVAAASRKRIETGRSDDVTAVSVRLEKTK